MPFWQRGVFTSRLGNVKVLRAKYLSKQTYVGSGSKRLFLLHPITR